MFIITASYKLKDDWEIKHDSLIDVVGRDCDYSTVDVDEISADCIRRMSWVVGTFKEAQDGRRLAEIVKDVTATVREV